MFYNHHVICFTPTIRAKDIVYEVFDTTLVMIFGSSRSALSGILSEIQFVDYLKERQGSFALPFLICSVDKLDCETQKSINQHEKFSHFFSKWIDEKSERMSVLVNEKDREGQTIIQSLAKIKEDQNYLDQFLNFNPNIEIQDSEGDIPISCAIQYGNEPVIRKLNAYKKSLTVVNKKNNKTTLMTAVISGQVHLIPYLIQAGVSVNACTNDGWNALMFAAEMGRADVVESLLSHGASVCKNAKHPATALFMGINR